MAATAAARAGSLGVESRRQARIGRRRERLLRSGLELFAERGYEETAVGAVVARARMSKSAFYEHFTSKEHFFREVLAAEGGALIRDVLADAAMGRDHHERLRLGITRFVRTCFERPTTARVLIIESVGLSAAVDHVRQEVQGRLADAVAEEVRHARGHDAFYADKDPKVFGRAVVGAVNDTVSYFLRHPGEDADSLAEGLCRIFAP
jgi:AcrR family transcriptional regulator